MAWSSRLLIPQVGLSDELAEKYPGTPSYHVRLAICAPSSESNEEAQAAGFATGFHLGPAASFNREPRQRRRLIQVAGPSSSSTQGDTHDASSPGACVFGETRPCYPMDAPATKSKRWWRSSDEERRAAFPMLAVAAAPHAEAGPELLTFIPAHRRPGFRKPLPAPPWTRPAWLIRQTGVKCRIVMQLTGQPMDSATWGCVKALGRPVNDCTKCCKAPFLEGLGVEFVDPSQHLRPQCVELFEKQCRLVEGQGSRGLWEEVVLHAALVAGHWRDGSVAAGFYFSSSRRRESRDT